LTERSTRGRGRFAPKIFRLLETIFKPTGVSNEAQPIASQFERLTIEKSIENCTVAHHESSNGLLHAESSGSAQHEWQSARRRCFLKNTSCQAREGEHDMPLVTVVLTLLVVGVLLWLINRFIPMQSQIKGILNGVVVIAVVLWLLKVFGLFGYISQFRVGHS
jgi:hypothetical protein